MGPRREPSLGLAPADIAPPRELDQDLPCELAAMVSPDSDKDDEDVDRHCENTQQGGKTFGSSTEIGLNEIGEKSF